MKSILQDASSAEKAIIKAWIQAGKPNDFSIKILNDERKPFLWFFNKQNTIVSINYKPFQLESNKNKLYDKRVVEKRLHFHSNDESLKEINKTNKQEETTIDNNEENLITEWDDLSTNYVKNKLEEIVKMMGITTEINTKQNKKILNVAFSKSITDKSNDEKRVFISLSHILMQSLKKSFKKKFAGFQLIISSNDTNDSTKTTIIN